MTPEEKKDLDNIVSELRRISTEVDTINMSVGILGTRITNTIYHIGQVGVARMKNERNDL